MTKPSALIVDGDSLARRFLTERLERNGFAVRIVSSGEESLAHLATERFDLVVLEQRLPQASGLETLRHALVLDPALTVVMTSTGGSMDDAVEAMTSGAVDCLEKPFSGEVVDRKVSRALALSRSRRALQAASRRSEQAFPLDGIVGCSEAMEQVRQLVRQVSDCGTATILLEGETGTGKEVVAQAIHASSARKERPFLQVNCAALPRELIESEIFGHEQGAFTHAWERKLGIIESAAGGTVLLDEIGDMPLEAQPKLLRLLEQRTFRRVGGVGELPADVRLIAATHVDLDGAVIAGRFRADLLYRLDVVRIRLPPLRERPEDLPLLVGHFIARFNAELKRAVSGVSSKALQALESHAWPGNIREVRNVVEWAFMLHPDMQELRPEHLPPALRGQPAKRTGCRPTALPTGTMALPEAERLLIAEAVRRASGNQSKAARMLGITRFTLRYRLRKHGLAFA